MSPEQASAKPLDARSDVFSFGAVLYEPLTGTRALTGDSAAQILSAVLRDDPKPLEAPPALQQIVRRCLAKDPDHRFPTMADVRQALQHLTPATADATTSIAVLPFAHLSRDADDEYFSDGLSEEIINALTQVRGLKVIARTSAFAFKGKNEDIRRIANSLGVTHVLEGSARRAGGRVRVAAQLIDAADGAHRWSQRYDREMSDIFAVQDD
jgi:eukaryotic-like serine/threonine-protein kinase